MIYVFDLDDTLYDESTFVLSGFRAVADYLSQITTVPPETLYKRCVHYLNCHGRGKVFDLVLEEYGIHQVSMIANCVRIYRHHQPDICLDPAAIGMLEWLRDKKMPTFLVTDGHKLVQQNKVNALNISSFFSKVYITHRYGVKNAKPSLHCFRLIVERTKCAWKDLLYVGDNPAKDFVNLNKVGAQTARIHTGSHKHVLANDGYDAKFHFENLSAFAQALFENKFLNT